MYRHLDPATLATIVADSAVLAGDRTLQAAAPDYWDFARPEHGSVVRTLAAVDDAGVREAADAVRRQPADVSAYRWLVTVLGDYLARPGPDTGPIARLAWQVECVSRLRVHVGMRIPVTTPPAAPVALDELAAAVRRGPVKPTGAGVDVAIVIPFRERSEAGHRTSNLLACLAALDEQSHRRDRYRVVVVETDEVARWRDRIAPLVDEYVFAFNDGPFNKAWAVNVGAVRNVGAAELLCVLDADMLVDRDFVARNVARFRVPGTQAHWPFVDLLFLDGASTARAIRQRCLHRESTVDVDRLRGVHLRRPPGGCIWVRAGTFLRVNGLDERFAGWGGEDLDFAYRLEYRGPLDRYNDPLVHLDHPRPPARTADGAPLYHSVRWASWPLDAAIGDPGRYGVGAHP